MAQFSIDAAAANLSRLIAEARAGDEVVMTDGKVAIVRLVPVVPPGSRCFGALKGEIGSDESFDEPLPQDEQAGWHLA